MADDLLIVKAGTFIDGTGAPPKRGVQLVIRAGRIVDVVASQGRIEKLAVAQGDAPGILDDLARMMSERVPGVPVERAEIGIVLGTHAGPGVFGVAALLAE